MQSRRLLVRPFAAMTAGLLAACGSVPTHFYTLLPPAQPNAATIAAAAFAIEVAPVAVPTEVDQAQWIVRTGQGEVALLENERWAAPLGDELRAAFADELTRLLGARDVYNSSKRPGQAVYHIQVHVRRFESVPGQHALIEADWSIARRDGTVGPTLECQSRASQSVEPGYAALAVGHQRAIAAIAARIALAVRGAAANAIACPPVEQE